MNVLICSSMSLFASFPRCSWQAIVSTLIPASHGVQVPKTIDIPSWNQAERTSVRRQTIAFLCKHQHIIPCLGHNRQSSLKMSVTDRGSSADRIIVISSHHERLLPWPLPLDLAALCGQGVSFSYIYSGGMLDKRETIFLHTYGSRWPQIEIVCL